jgi:curved DNA-binding protein CbpA
VQGDADCWQTIKPLWDRVTNGQSAIKDYYGILGVLPTAETVVVAAAYRELAKKYHPDKWRGERSVGEARMRELNEAYENLSSERRRSKYDRLRNKTVDHNFSESDIQDAGQAQRSTESAKRQAEKKQAPSALGLTVLGLQIVFRLFVYGCLALLAIVVVLSIVIYAFQTGH